MNELPTCSVCEQPVEQPRQHAECDECGRAFHLNLRIDIEAPRCGAAYIGAACGMNVYCDPCGARLAASAASAGSVLARVE
jgi:hypothetical protein